MVTVLKETDANTISRSEYRRIKKGMKLSAVKRIVGNKGLKRGSYQVFDQRGGYAWAGITFRKGRVVAKEWSLEGGDGGVR